MAVILLDLSKQSLIGAIESNILEFLRYLGRSTKAEAYDTPNTAGFVSGIPSSVMNGLCSKTSFANNGLDDGFRFLQSRNVPFLWWVRPTAQSGDLAGYAAARGLTYGMDLYGMATDLLEFHDDHAVDPELSIKPVRDAETLNYWLDAAFDGFELPGNIRNASYDFFEGLGFDFPMRSYVGLVNGKPVASSQLLLAGGVAGFYWVSTVPGMRRKGLGMALTSVSLGQAREMGYRIGVLHSSAMGLGVYRRLGFEEHCRIQLWTGESEKIDEI